MWYGQAFLNDVSNWTGHGVCCQGGGREGGGEGFAARAHTQPPPQGPHSQSPGANGDLKIPDCCEAILCKLAQRREKDSFWRKAEYNLPGGLRGLRLTGQREWTQCPAVPMAKLRRSLAHNYSNVPKGREVWRNKGHMSESYSWPSNPFPNLIIVYLWNSPVSIRFSFTLNCLYCGLMIAICPIFSDSAVIASPSCPFNLLHVTLMSAGALSLLDFQNV